MSFVDTDVLIANAFLRDVDYVHELIALVEDTPKADVVKVTRCKDCIAWNPFGRCGHSGRINNGPNSYCDRGTRKDDLRL